MEKNSGNELRRQPKQYSDAAKIVDLREVARRALLQLLEPLAGFALDSGLSTNDVNAMFRAAAIRSVASKQLESSNRVNISGIAATTGIPRAEISRILKLKPGVARKSADSQLQSTNRMLAAWHDDPKFTGPSGRPAELKMYGRGATFETLARKYGRGIPTRALLDELIRAGAIELLDTQRIRAKTLVAIDRGMSARAMKAFGDRAAELLSTMLVNMRQPDTARFIANVADTSIAARALPLFRKELSSKGAEFLAEIRESMSRHPAEPKSQRIRQDPVRISVTIFYHESVSDKIEKPGTTQRRRNFRRET